MIIGFIVENCFEVHNHIKFLLGNVNKEMNIEGVKNLTDLKFRQSKHLSENPFGSCLVKTKRMGNNLCVVFSFDESSPAFVMMPKFFSKFIVGFMLKMSFRKKKYGGIWKRVSFDDLIDLFLFDKWKGEVF